MLAKLIETCNLNCAKDVPNTKECLPALASSIELFAMNEKQKKRPVGIDRDKRNQRRRALRRVEHTHLMSHEDGRSLKSTRVSETSIEQAEGRQLVAEMIRSFTETVEFYKSDFGGLKPHDEAVKEALSINESRRQYVQGVQPEQLNWSDMTAVAEVSMDDGLALWARIREAADDELESGRRAAKVAGDNASPFALAQFLAIRDQFADHWQPQGGIESALIDMLTISFSLHMYWSTVANQRAMWHTERQKDFRNSKTWKSPYQFEADAIEQAYRLADGHNRQFLRVLRQLRDLRRYAPVVIQNAQQVNVGNQQLNVSG